MICDRNCIILGWELGTWLVTKKFYWETTERRWEALLKLKSNGAAKFLGQSSFCLGGAVFIIIIITIIIIYLFKLGMIR